MVSSSSDSSRSRWAVRSSVPSPSRRPAVRSSFRPHTWAVTSWTVQAGHIGTAQANELARLAANPRVADQLAPVLSVLMQHAEHLRFDDFRVVVVVMLGVTYTSIAVHVATACPTGVSADEQAHVSVRRRG